MVKALLVISKALHRVPVFEAAGAGLGIAAGWVLGGLGVGLAVASGLALLKSFDLALEKD